MKHILSIIGLCFLGFALAFSQSGVGGKGGFGGKGGSGGGTTASVAAIVLDGTKHCQNDNGATPSTTISCALTSVTAGDLITCHLGADAASIQSIGDSTNGLYTFVLTSPITVSSDTGQPMQAIFANAAAGTYSPTLTLTTAAAFVGISCEAWKNARTTNVVDTTFGQQQYVTTTANPNCGTSQTPANNGELILGTVSVSAGTPVAGTNYTLIDVDTTTITYPEYWIQTSKTATNAPYTLASADWDDMCAAYLPSSAAAGATVKNITLLDGSGGSNGATVTNATLLSSTKGVLANTGTLTYQPGTISTQWSWTNALSTPLLSSKWSNGATYSSTPTLTLEYTTIANPTGVTYTHWFDGTNQASSWNTATLAAWVQWDVTNADANAYDFLTIYNGAGGEFTVMKITSGVMNQEVKAGDTCTVGCAGLAISPSTWYGIILQYNNATATGTHIAEVCNTSGTLLFTGNVTTTSTNKAGNSEIGPSGAEPETAGKHFYFDWIMDNWLIQPTLTGTSADCTALL